MPIDPRQRIAIYLDRMIATRPEGVTLPTFSALFDPASAEPYRNYATPVGGTCPAEADLRALIEEFERRGRVPRLEFVPDASPGLAQALLDAGFVEEGLLPLMILGPRRTDLEESLPIAFSLAYSPPELAEAARVQNEAFGGEPTSQADIDRLLRLVGRGGLVAIGREPPGNAVASGLVTAPVESVFAKFRIPALQTAGPAIQDQDLHAEGHCQLRISGISMP